MSDCSETNPFPRLHSWGDKLKVMATDDKNLNVKIGGGDTDPYNLGCFVIVAAFCLLLYTCHHL
jgi:hypothetical protein